MRIVSFAALLPLLPLCSASSSSGVVRKRSQVNHVSKGEEAGGQGVRQRQLQKGEEEEVVEPAASTSMSSSLSTSMSMSMSMSTSMSMAPPAADAADMCSFCAGGMVDPDLVLPTNDGTTCTTASTYASTLAASDIMCGTVLMAEPICCPPAAAVVDPAATTAAPPVDPTDAVVVAVDPTEAVAPVDPTDAVVAVDPTEAAPAEPATSLPAAVTIDPAVSMPASMPVDDALFGGKSGKGSKSKAMKKTPKSGKALPVKDAKAEKVKSISTKVAKTEAVPARR